MARKHALSMPKRDMARFPNDDIGTRLFRLHADGVDLDVNIEMVFIGDFLAPRKFRTVDHAPTRANAERFKMAAEQHAPDVRLLDFSNIEMQWGTDISVEARFQVAPTHGWIKWHLNMFEALARTHKGSVRWFANDRRPGAAGGWIILRPDARGNA